MLFYFNTDDEELYGITIVGNCMFMPVTCLTDMSKKVRQITDI